MVCKAFEESGMRVEALLMRWNEVMSLLRQGRGVELLKGKLGLFVLARL